eukprot:gene4557-14737_t
METRVLIAHSSAPAAAGIGESFSVPDRNGKQSQAYLWAGGCLQEVNRFKQKQSSWFVGGGVVSDGGVYMATPVDPIFVLLPVLERSRAKTASSSGMFCPLEQILSDPISPALHVLLNGGGGGGGEGEEVQGSAPSTTPISELLLSVCEVKDAGGDKYYRVSDEMVKDAGGDKYYRVSDEMVKDDAGGDKYYRVSDEKEKDAGGDKCYGIRTELVGSGADAWVELA